jgi:hypothetical protein
MASHAQDDESETKAKAVVEEAEAATDNLKSTVIKSDPTFDWIMINSGEWLKGRIKAMLDEKLEFDSDELDLQSFDWEDVYFLYSPKLNGIRTENKITDYGTLWIDKTNIVVTSGVTNRYSREEVLGIAPGGPRERNYWTGKASVGLAIRQGNVNQVDFNTSVNLRRITPSTRLSFDYIGNFSELESVESANNHRATISFDIFLSRRLFIRTPFLEYYRDPFQNIDGRFTAGAALGYDIVKGPKVDWGVTAGPAYQSIRYVSVQPGEKIKQTTPAVVLGTELDWEISSKLDFEFGLRSQIGSQEAGGVQSHLVTTLEYEVTKIFDLETSFIIDSVSNPTADSNGDVPQKSDLRLIFGIALDF